MGRMLFLSTRHGGAAFVSSHVGDKNIGRDVWFYLKEGGDFLPFVFDGADGELVTEVWWSAVGYG